MVIIILLITYRSPILWIFPVICVVFALFSAQGVIYLLAKYADLTVNAQTRSILSVLVLGAGTDYALLLVARYREELRRHHDRHEAMSEALHRAGPAIIASGSTVIVGMLCLLVAEMNSTLEHGSGARHRRGRRPAGDDHLAAGAAGDHGPLDLLAGEADRGQPRADLDGLLGQDRLGDQPPPTHGLDQHVRRPRRMALGTVTLDATGLTNDEQFVGTPDSVKGERVIEEHFASAGDNNLQIVANAEAADQVVATVSDVEGVNSEAVTVAGEQDGTALILAGIEDSVVQRGGLCHGRAGPRRRPRDSRTRMPWSAATPRSTWTSRRRRSTTTES